MSRVTGPGGNPAFVYAFFKLYTRPIACHLYDAHGRCELKMVCCDYGRFVPELC